MFDWPALSRVGKKLANTEVKIDSQVCCSPINCRAEHCLRMYLYNQHGICSNPIHFPDLVLPNLRDIQVVLRVRLEQ